MTPVTVLAERYSCLAAIFPFMLRSSFHRLPALRVVGGFAVMKSQIILRARRDQEDLAAKLKQLVRLRSQLVDRELFLTNLRSEVNAFEIRYMRQVGALYLKLDEWNSKIAKAHAEELYFDSARIQQELLELLGGEYTGPVADGSPSSWAWVSVTAK